MKTVEFVSILKDYFILKSFLNRAVYKSKMNKRFGVYKAYDEKQLEIGREIEKEHTNDPQLAEQIAKDHLDEIPDYYDRLVEMENEAKKDKAPKAKCSINHVIEFLKNNPNPDDKTLHNWAEKNAYNVHNVEALMYQLATKYVMENNK